MSGNTTTIQDVLDEHYVGTFNVRIRNVAPTTLVRVLSEKGIEAIQESIQRAGWIKKETIYVVADEESLPTPEQCTAAVNDPDGFIFEPKTKV